MPIDVAAGYPQLKDAGVIMTHYTDKVNIEYYATCLLPRITNSKFTGEVKDKGDKVIIPTRPVITTKPYVKGMNLETEYPESDPIELEVNRARYWRFGLDHIDIHQMHVVLSDESKSDAVERMRIDTEEEFFEDIIGDAHASNMGLTAGAKSGAYNLGSAVTPLALTTTNIIELLTSVRAVLGEQNAVKKGMWIILPEWARFLLVNSDLKNASLTGDDRSVLRTGRLLEIDGLTIYCSNLLYNVTIGGNQCTYIPAGNGDAITFVAQMARARAFEAQNTFGMIYDGLHVYDWKVVKPEGLVTVLARKG